MEPFLVSPRKGTNAALKKVADEMNTTMSLLYHNNEHNLSAFSHWEANQFDKAWRNIIRGR